MSDNTNYVRVGSVRVEREVGDPLELHVGVRADLAKVMVSAGGSHTNIPALTSESASQLGELLIRASLALPKVVAAHEAYRQAAADALQEFQQEVARVR